MRVGIVGAGISGLSAARALKAAGHEAVLFEKSRGVGGRVATRRAEGFVWDTGATSIAPRGRSIERVMREELDTTDLHEITRPIYTHEGLRVAPGHPNRIGSRYTYRTGNRTLAKLLAEGLDVRLERTVDAIEREGESYRILDERFDAVILTPPVPQTALLLWGLEDARPLAQATYRACLSVNLGFAVPPPDVPYHALIDIERRHPLAWLSVESLKSPDRAPEGGCAFGAQLSPAFSREQYALPDSELIAAVLEFLERLYGPVYLQPAAFTVMRWKYAQPIGTASFDEVNPVGSRVLVASDGLLGGHVEEAYEVGQMAAARLLSL
ncbi:MAG: NAD(P)/FAD-dependent oxidoreductase [Fimbriimonas sp.]